jgi:beta-glucosidase
VAVIGPLADDQASQLGPWAGDGQAKDAVTPLEGIVAKLGKEHVLYAKGVEIPPYEGGLAAGVAAPAPPSATGVRGVANTGKAASIDDAVTAAKKADVVVLFLGELAGMTGEASSRSSLDFPGDQLKLANAVIGAGKPVVLVVESGRPLDIRWATYHTQAILQAWFPGVQAGNAIADLLFGDASPSGRLAISWPRSTGSIPVYYNHRNTGRPAAPDRWKTGYLDLPSGALFPFGFGLTYSNFSYGRLSVKTPAISQDGMLEVNAEVENTGAREATEVVQLYVHDRVGLTSRPIRELKSFERVTLRPGERKTLNFTVKANDLGSYDPQMRWVVNPGAYDVWVAPDSASGVQGSFEVK